MASKKKCYFFLTNSVFLWHFSIIFLKKLNFHQNIIWSSSNLLILQAICSFVSMNPILSIWDISSVNFLIENHSETDFFEKNECILSWEPVCKKLKISMVFYLGNQVKAFFDRFYDAWSDKSRCITDFRRFLWFFDSVLSTWLKFCHEKTTILAYFLTLRYFFTMIHSL